MNAKDVRAIKQFLAARSEQAHADYERRGDMATARYGDRAAPDDFDFGYWAGFYAGLAEAYRTVLGEFFDAREATKDAESESLNPISGLPDLPTST